MTLRPLGPDDDEAAWALRARALGESPDAFVTHLDEHPPLPAYRALQAERRRTQEQRVIGAFVRGRLAGVATVVRSQRRKTRHRADLYGLYVTPEARGRGVGRALLEASLEAARELGARRLELAVSARNEPAVTLYRDVGFRPWGVQPQAVKLEDGYLEETHMAISLDLP